jgi:hypothetical protein
VIIGKPFAEKTLHDAVKQAVLIYEEATAGS